MNNLEAYVIAVAVLFGIVSVGVIYYTIDAIIRRSKKNKKMHPEERQFEEKGKMKEENVTNITKNNTIDPVFKKDEIESLDYVV